MPQFAASANLQKIQETLQLLHNARNFKNNQKKKKEKDEDGDGDEEDIPSVTHDCNYTKVPGGRAAGLRLFLVGSLWGVGGGGRRMPGSVWDHQAHILLMIQILHDPVL